MCTRFSIGRMGRLRPHLLCLLAMWHPLQQAMITSKKEYIHLGGPPMLKIGRESATGSVREKGTTLGEMP